MAGFEGSFLGRDDRIDDQAALECGVCWWVYDPAMGDPIWQIPAGTPFSGLPDHWRCPKCDAAPHQFMVVGSSDARRGAGEDGEGSVAESADIAGSLQRAYEDVAGRMRALPVYREDLPLGVCGPRRCEDGIVSLVYSPWCMNLVLLSGDAQARVEGSEREVSFPSGEYHFVRGHLPGVGAVENCSLFSPMEDFADAAAVEAVAREILDALFTAPQETATQASQTREEVPDPSRRRFLRGNPQVQAAP